MNEFFKKGQRVRVTENYAKNINAGDPNTLDETGALATVVRTDQWYIEVEFTDRELFEGIYLFTDDELEPV